MTVGLEGGAETVGLAGGGRTHDNRGQETGRDPRAEKSCRRLAGTCQGGGDGRSWRSVSALVHRQLSSERHYAEGAAFGS